MPRRAIIIVLIILILGIVGGTAVLLLQRLNSSNQTASNNTSANGAPGGSFPVSGSANNENQAPATTNQPTGTQIPPAGQPASSLPPGGQVFPASQSTQAISDAEEWSALADTNLTALYQSTTPIAKRSDYARQHFIDDMMPDLTVAAVNDSLLTRSADSSPKALQGYLNQTQDTQNLLSTRPVNTMYLASFHPDDLTDIQGVKKDLDAYKSILLGAPVPPAALSTHILLLGYIQRFDDIYQQIIPALHNDPVKTDLLYAYAQTLWNVYGSEINDQLDSLKRTVS